MPILVIFSIAHGIPAFRCAGVGTYAERRTYSLTGRVKLSLSEPLPWKRGAVGQVGPS